MADRPTQVPEWASDAAAEVVEPPEGKKQQGWTTGEKPPAGFFNWWMGLASAWLAWFADRIGAAGDEGIAVRGITSTAPDGGQGERGGSFTASGARPGVVGTGGDAGTGGNGVEGYGKGTTGVGVRGVGSGSGPGVAGIGSSGGAGSVGIRGTGTGAHPGVLGKGSPDGAGGPGVRGEGTGTSAGVEGIGTVDRPAVRSAGFLALVPSAVPAAPAAGVIYHETGTNRLGWYDGAAWVDIAVPAAETKPQIVGEAGGPAFTPEWGHFVTANKLRFYRRNGRVWLDGSAFRGPAGSDDTIFTLPVGYRPPGAVYFPGRVGQGPEYRIQILASGVVSVFGGPPAGSLHAYLDGLSFALGAT